MTMLNMSLHLPLQPVRVCRLPVRTVFVNTVTQRAPVNKLRFFRHEVEAVVAAKGGPNGSNVSPLMLREIVSPCTECELQGFRRSHIAGARVLLLDKLLEGNSGFIRGHLFLHFASF